MPLAGCFTDASAAAGYLGQLIDLAQARPTVRHGQDHWWVLAEIPLNLGRELVDLAGGRGYLRHSTRLVPDPGWGPAPQPGKATGIALAELREVPVLELIKTAGLRARLAAPRDHIVVLVPAVRATSLLRRALDLRLDAAFRPVRLRPLFESEKPPGDPPGQPEQEPGTLIEVRLRAAGHGADHARHLPYALVSALDDDPVALLCREVSPRLLVQHDRYSPLADQQLDALVDADAWVLADPPHGCWSLRPLADFAEAGSLVELGEAHRLVPGEQSWPDHDPAESLPRPAELKIVPASDTDAPIDALLLDDDDLAGLPPLLEGHPLAEFAALVPGRDRHLLLAPGGIIERIPLGEYLSSVGPGPIYLAHGWRTEPLLPAAMWRQLISPAPETALVLEPDRTLVFDLSLRRPVWELWAGELPPFNPQLRDDAAQALTRIDDQLRPPALQSPHDAGALRQPAAADGRSRSARAQSLLDRLIRRHETAPPRLVTWQDQAHEAELAGDLVSAARLHDQHGDPARAARLYERAAFEGSVPS